MTENCQDLEYRFSLDNPETTNSSRSISAMCASSTVVGSCSSVSLTVWFISSSSSREKMLKNRAGLERMFRINESSWMNESASESDEDNDVKTKSSMTKSRSSKLNDEGDDQHDDEEEQSSKSVKSRCNVQ